jgi:hypothetical protein
MNYIFISPNFPDIYYNFVTSLNKLGIFVLGIGDVPFTYLNEELKSNLKEYQTCNLKNYNEVKTIVQYYQDKYGPIDYIESNNEFWLQLDALLRSDFNVQTGLNANSVIKIKSKIAMKEFFEKAGAKVARYIRPDNRDKTNDFIKLVGYPVFVKPEIGVGADDSYPLRNEYELDLFFSQKKTELYIMEEYVTGELISFDGICNSKSEVVFCIQEVFLNSGADIVNYNLDDFYYVNPYLDETFLQLGKAVVKSFEIYKRYFHIEFFKLSIDKEGLGNKGDYIALEVNMRSPGGNSVELINKASGCSSYDIYAQIIKDDLCKENTNNKTYAVTCSRKDIYNYRFSFEEIFYKYAENIFKCGRYPKEIALEMGDTYFYAVFEELKDVFEFDNYIRKKN